MRPSIIFFISILFILSLAVNVNGETVSATEFSCMFPRVSSSKVSQWLPELNSVLQSYGINTRLRVMMFLAQTGHETDRYNTFTEYTNADGTNGWCHNYDGGCTYRGRGAMQLTHRYNYKAAGDALGSNFVGNPSSVATVPWAFKTAGWFWKTKSLNTQADAQDVEGATRKINGGTNGLADRKALYELAKECFGGSSDCSPKTYTIRSGDTLSSIAIKFSTTVAKICAANSISDPNKIYVGQTLIIPC